MTTEQVQEFTALQEEKRRLADLYHRMQNSEDQNTIPGVVVRKAYTVVANKLLNLKRACDHTKPDGNPAVAPFLSWDKCAICNVLVSRQ
jgi:hypothetical protein